MTDFERAMEAEAHRQEAQKQAWKQTLQAEDRAAQAEINEFVDAMSRRGVPTDRTLTVEGRTLHTWTLTYCVLHSHGTAIGTTAELIRWSGTNGQVVSPRELQSALRDKRFELPALALSLVRGDGPFGYDCSP